MKNVLEKLRARRGSPLGGIPLKWQIFRGFCVFTVVVLLILWLSQTVFLDDFYQAVKLGELRRSASRIASVLGTDKLSETAEQTASGNNLCLLIYDERGRKLLSRDTRVDCVIHHIDSDTIGNLYAEAKRSGGEAISRFKRSYYRESGDHEGDILADSIVFTKIAVGSDGKSYIMMLNTVTAPVAATVNTLRIQLAVISGVTVVMALLTALFMSKSISTPIVKLTGSAKALAAGRHDADFSVVAGCREVRALSETLAFASREVSKADRMQKELIANISHDLRTPLTLIKGYGEVMRDIPGEMTAENMQVIIDETERLSSLVSDLVDVSRFEAGGQVLSFSRFDLSETVRETLSRYRRLTERDGYTIEFESADGALPVNADKTRILQVIYNLINNALNYTGEDRKVFIRTMRRGDAARVEIRDTGDGIEPDKLELIWDRYYKLDRVHRRAAVGTGLGLSIVKNIIDLHGGKYGVESTAGKGSTFSFELPISESDQE